MGAKFLRIVPILAEIVVILTFVKARNEAAERVGLRSYGYLEFVATVDGRDFFVNQMDRMNFLESSQYCQDFEMELASLPTRKHYDKIIGVLKGANNYGYWTSATFSRRPSMFVWGNTGKLLNEDHVPSWQNKYLRRIYCVVLYTSHTDINPSGLYPVNCTSNQPFICQTNMKGM